MKNSIKQVERYAIKASICMKLRKKEFLHTLNELLPMNIVYPVERKLDKSNRKRNLLFFFTKSN